MLLALGLLVLIVMLPWTTARHTLTAVWPWPVEERVMPAGNAGRLERVFVPLDEARRLENEALARSRPHALTVVELRSGSAQAGFVVGVRSGPDAPLSPPPADTGKSPDFEALAPGQVLVLMLADESRLELATEDISRVYQPNRMGPHERAELAGRRLTERIEARFR